MEYLVGIILLISFFGLAYYCIKGHNLMVGFMIISVFWTILSLGGAVFASEEFIAANPVLHFENGNTLVSILNKIYQSAPEAWGTTLVNVCWGAWFGRVLMETGIASTLIRKTVELGGDKPLVTAALLNIVTAMIFTAMTGAGPVIAIGVIVLPILMSLGIPKAIALFSFMGSVAAGICLNPVNFAQYRAFFIAPDQMPEFTLGWYALHWGYTALLIMLVSTTFLLAIFLKRAKTVHAWAASTRSAGTEQKNAPFYTLILPIVPVVLKIWLDFSVIGGFVIAGFSALFLCGKMKGNFRENCQLVNKLYYDGVVDTAPLIGFLLTLPMFNTVATYASPYFNMILGNVMPRSELVVCVVFAAFLFLGFFRGPLTLVGCGAATLGVLSNVASFSIPFLYAVFAIPTITVTGSCVTQSWVAWGVAYTKVENREFLKMSIPNAYLAGILQYVAIFLMLGGLGAEWFIK